MAENIVVTLKQEKEGALWPFVRGCFAWIGFAAVVVALPVLESPDPQGAALRIIEAAREGARAFEAGYRAKANPYGQAPAENPYGDIPLDPLPNTALGNPSENRN
jgi:hypothetical protein